MEQQPIQQIYVTDAQCLFTAKLKGLVCAITSKSESSDNSPCQFSLCVNESIIASSKDGVMYFTEQYIINPILFGAGKCLEINDKLKGLDATNLCSWRYDGLKIICDTPNTTLTVHTVPIWMFLST